MARFWKFVGTVLVEIALWIADKRWGDTMFAWLKRQVPDEVERWLVPTVEFVWDWGLPAVVALLGLYLIFWRPSGERKEPRSLAEQAISVVQSINELNAKYPLIMPDHESYASSGRVQNNAAKNAYLREYRERVATNALQVLAKADAKGFLHPEDRLYLKGEISYGGANLIREILLRVAVGREPNTAAQPEFVSMKDAAKRAYAAFRSTRANDMVPQGEWSVGEPLSWCAAYLALRGLPIYGTHRYSDARERIDPDELRGLNFEKEATELHGLSPNGAATFTELEVRAADLAPYIEAIKQEYSD